MIVCRLDAALEPDTEPAGVTTGVPHVYVVFSGVVVGVTSNKVPLQIVAV